MILRIPVMKNYIFCLLIILLFPVISCDAKAVIVFDDTIHDFGTLKTESTAKHTFNFKNAGTSTLIIERIKAG
jgi:hypothetical protein